MLTNFLEPECLSATAVTCWHAVPAGDTAEAREFEVFADAVAHDLRQPLRTISMFTELLLRRTELDAAAQQLAQNIIDGIERTAALLDGFHAFAIRGYDEPLLPVDISQVVVDVLRDVGHAITAGGATVTAEALPVAHGRADHLSRIFQNLIVNAVRYRGALPPQVHISAEAIESEWIISVRDMALEYRQSIVNGSFCRSSVFTAHRFPALALACPSAGNWRGQWVAEFW